MKKFFIFLMSILLISCNGQENKVSKKKEAEPALPPRQEVLLEEIRDLLKK